MIILPRTRCPGCGAELMGVAVNSTFDHATLGTSQTVEAACLDGCRIIVERRRAPLEWIPLAREILESIK